MEIFWCVEDRNFSCVFFKTSHQKIQDKCCPATQVTDYFCGRRKIIHYLLHNLLQDHQIFIMLDKSANRSFPKSQPTDANEMLR